MGYIEELLEEKFNACLADLEKNAVQPKEKIYLKSSVLPEDKFSEFISIIKTKATFDEAKLHEELTAKLIRYGDIDASLSSKEYKEHAYSAVNKEDIECEIFESMGIDVEFWDIEDEIEPLFAKALVPGQAGFQYWKFDELMKDILVDTFGSNMKKDELLEVVRKNNFSSAYSQTLESLNSCELPDAATEIVYTLTSANFRDYIKVEFEEEIEIYNKECTVDDCDHKGDEFTCEKLSDTVDLAILSTKEAFFCYQYNNEEYFDANPLIKKIEFQKRENGLYCKVILCLDSYTFEDSFLSDAFGFDKTGTMNFENCSIKIGDYLCAFFLSPVHGDCEYVDEC